MRIHAGDESMTTQARPNRFEIDGHSLTFAATGPEALDRLCALIDSARHELQLLYYIFASDSAGARVRDAIQRAAERGVKAWLMVDGFGSDATPRSFFAPLEAAGVHVCRFSPRLGRRYLLRNHQKMAIADHSHAIVGGFNLEEKYFVPDRPDSWRDYGVEVTGPSIRHLAHYYRSLFGWSTRRSATLKGMRALIRSSSQRKGAVRWLIGGPTLRPNGFVRALKADLGVARDLKMSMAYFAPNPGMLRRLGSVARLGSASIVTAAKSDNTTTIDAARHCYNSLLRRGVVIHEYLKQRLHAKLLVIDDIAYIGSANFDVRSLYLNLEVMLRVEDEAFARHIRSTIDGDIEDSVPIDRTRYREMSNWWRKIKWTIAYFIVAVLDFNVARRLNLDGD